MKTELYTENPEAYLTCGDVVDFDDEAVAELSDALFHAAVGETDFVRKAYEYVRDVFPHSADIGSDSVPCSASEVLKAGHGICFAKSHLLAAILRHQAVPAGFCYQKLILDDEAAPVLVYHGLNGVYLSEYRKWIRLDARGNKPGVNAQFSIDGEQLAFPVRPEMGEEDGLLIYPDPDQNIVKTMQESKTRTELWDKLPAELDYKKKAEQ